MNTHGGLCVISTGSDVDHPMFPSESPAAMSSRQAVSETRVPWGPRTNDPILDTLSTLTETRRPVVTHYMSPSGSQGAMVAQGLWLSGVWYLQKCPTSSSFLGIGDEGGEGGGGGVGWSAVARGPCLGPSAFLASLAARRLPARAGPWQ